MATKKSDTSAQSGAAPSPDAAPTDAVETDETQVGMAGTDAGEPSATAAEAPSPYEPADVPPTGDGALAADPPVFNPEPAAVAAPHTAYAGEHVEEESHEDLHEEERGRSFAARALIFLLVLLAGAALGIWAAPRLAPRLPAGLAPVAAWLTPGQARVDEDIAALQTRLDGEIATLNAQLAAVPDAGDLQSETASLVAAARTDLTGKIDALRTELAQPDSGDVNDRLGRLETALDGATAELASLKDQLSAGAASLSSDAAASIDTYRAELEGLKAEVGRLSGAVSGLSGRLEEVAASAEARVTAAQTEAAKLEQTAAAERDLSAARADLAAIGAALANGEPFQESLNSLTADVDVTAPAGLSDAAASGVSTLAALRTSFSDAAHQAIRASITASAGEGLLARSQAFLEAQVAGRSLTPQPGQTPDAMLSRAEDALRRDDVNAALAEVEQLPSEALAAMQGWSAAAKQRADAEAGLAELSTSLSTLN